MIDFLTKEWWQQAILEDVKAKITAGVDLNARNEAGSSPLIMAASFAADPNIIAELIDAGADLDAKDWLTGSVLANAARYNPNPDIINTLLKYGAAVNEEDINDEMTPLMFAAKYNPNPEVIKSLLAAGADVLARDVQGNTAADYFERAEEYPEIKNLLAPREENVGFVGESTDEILAQMEKSAGLTETDREYLYDIMTEYLTPREERVLRMRFGIGMDKAQTLEEVGNQFNVACERIRQIEAKALRKLRQPEVWKKIEYLPYWGNSAEEKFLRCLHLIYFNQSRQVEQYRLKTGFDCLDAKLGGLKANDLLMIQGECLQAEQFAISLMQSILSHNDGYIMLFNAPDFRNFTTTIFDKPAKDKDIALINSRMFVKRIFKRDTVVTDAKILQNSLECWLSAEKYRYFKQHRMLAVFTTLPKQFAANEADFVVKLKELAQTLEVPVIYLQENKIIDYTSADVIIALEAVNGYQEPIEISITKPQSARTVIKANAGSLKYCEKLKDCKGLWFFEEK